MILALLSLAAVPWSPAPFVQDAPKAEPPRKDSRQLDSAALIVNEEIITDDGVLRLVLRQRQFINTEEDRLKIQMAVVRAMVNQLLKEQAGKVLGYDEKVIESFVKNDEKRQLEQAGSVSKLAEIFLSEDIDSSDYRTDARSRVYAQLWEGATIGKFPGPGGRPSVDRYLRPGRLLFEYRNNLEQIQKQSQEFVELQEMSFGLRPGTAPDEANQALEGLRQRVLAGEDFAQVAEEGRACKPGSGGRLTPIPVQQLESFLPEIHEFVVNGKPGDISVVIESEQPGTGARRVRFVKLIAIVPARKIDFLDPEFQTEFAKLIETNLDNYRISVGLRELFDAAFVWPPEFRGPPKTSESKPPATGLPAQNP